MTTNKTEKYENLENRFPQTVIALAMVSFFMNVSTSIFTSTSITFVKNCVTTDTTFLVSLRSLAEGFSYFIKVLIGAFSDITKKRKLFLLIGYGSMLFIKPIFIVVALNILPMGLNTVFYAMAQISDRLLNAVRDTPRDTIIADVTKLEKRSQAYSCRRFFAAMGSQVGALFSIFFLKSFSLFNNDNNLKYILLYIIASLPAFYCILILKNKVQEPVKTKEEEKEDWFSLKLLLKEKSKLANYIFLMIITFVMSFGKFNEICIFQMGSKLGYSDSFVIGSYMYFYAIVALSSYILSLQKKKDNTIVVLYSTFSLLLNNILLGYFSGHLLALILGLTCLGIYVGITESVISGTITTIFTEKNMRATLFGIMNTVLGISTVTSGFVITFLTKKISLEMVYRYGIIPPILSMLLFILFYSASYKKTVNTINV